MIWLKVVWLTSFFLLPFFQGGYFYFEKVGFACIQLFLFMILVFKGKFKISFQGYRKFLYLYILFVFMSPLVAIDKGMQIFNILSLLGVLLFSFNMDSLMEDLKEVFFVYLIALWVMAILTLIGVFFTPDNGGLFNYLVQGSRIGGFFQYANTFGIFYLLGIVYCTSQEETGNLQLFYRLSGFMYSLIVILTDSRMVFVIGIIYCLFFILINGKRWIEILLVFLGGMSGYLLLQRFLEKIQQTGVLVNVRELDFSASEWQSRLLYYEDGLSMLTKHPFGTGHLGYFYSQSYYQTGAAYHVKHIHSSVLQSSLDYGIFAGILIFILGSFSLITVLKVVLKNYNSEQKAHKLIKIHKQKILYMIGLSGFFVHTCFDFDLQFISIWLLFLVSLKYMEALVQDESIEKSILFKVLINLKVRRIIAFLVLVLMSITIWYEILSFMEYEDKDVEVLKQYPAFTEAITDVIYNRTYNENISVNEFKEIVIDKVNSNSYYSEGFAFLRDYYYNNGDLVSSLEQSDKVILLKPLWEDSLIIHSKITLSYLRQRFNNQILLKDDPRLIWLMNIESYIKDIERLKSNHYDIKHKVNFEVPNEVWQYIEEAINIYMQLKANGE